MQGFFSPIGAAQKRTVVIAISVNKNPEDFGE